MSKWQYDGSIIFYLQHYKLFFFLDFIIFSGHFVVDLRDQTSVNFWLKELTVDFTSESFYIINISNLKF